MCLSLVTGVNKEKMSLLRVNLKETTEWTIIQKYICNNPHCRIYIIAKIKTKTTLKTEHSKKQPTDPNILLFGNDKNNWGIDT